MVAAEEPNVKIIDILVLQILPLDSRLDLICFCITLYIMCSSIGLYYSQSMHRSLLVSVQQVVQPVLPPIPSPPLHRYPPMLFSCSLPPHLPNMHSCLLCHVEDLLYRVVMSPDSSTNLLLLLETPKRAYC